VSSPALGDSDLLARAEIGRAAALAVQLTLDGMSDLGIIHLSH
jgi:hypothetical protein